MQEILKYLSRNKNKSKISNSSNGRIVMMVIDNYDNYDNNNNEFLQILILHVVLKSFQNAFLF